MTALAKPSPILTAPDDKGAVFAAIVDTLATVAGYIEIAGRSAELRDARSLGYGLRCASAALISAGELAQDVRPSPSVERR